MPVKMALPAKAKMTAFVCRGRSRPKASHGVTLREGRARLEGDVQPHEHADQAPDEGGDHELPDDRVVVLEGVELCVHDGSRSGHAVPACGGRE